mgnify:CR=1 FL=1
MYFPRDFEPNNEKRLRGSVSVGWTSSLDFSMTTGADGFEGGWEIEGGVGRSGGTVFGVGAGTVLLTGLAFGVGFGTVF